MRKGKPRNSGIPSLRQAGLCSRLLGNERLCHRKRLMLFSLKFQRKKLQNALAMMGKLEKKAVFYRAVEMKQPHAMTGPNEKAPLRAGTDQRQAYRWRRQSAPDAAARRCRYKSDSPSHRPSAQQASHPYLAAALPPDAEGKPRSSGIPSLRQVGLHSPFPRPPLWTRAAGLLPVFQKIQGYIKGCSLRPYKKQKMPVPKREHGRRAMRAPSAGLPLFAEKPYPWKGRKGADDAFNLFHTTP